MDGDDRISVLPEEVKVSILSRVSIGEAVRTSVLSSAWRHLWTLLPGLQADEDFFYDLNLHFPDLDDDETDQPPHVPHEMSRWIGIIERLLSSLRGPILYFSFFPATKSYHAPHLNRFLHFIFHQGGLHKLSICRSYRTSIPAPSLHLPYFASLKQLHLYWVHLCLPTHFRGFHHLTTLKLERVFVSQHDINALINMSGKLTSFDGRYLCGTNDEESLLLTFNSPLLQYIVFQFEMPLAQARVAYAPCLESVYLIASHTYTFSGYSPSAWLAAATTNFIPSVTITRENPTIMKKQSMGTKKSPCPLFHLACLFSCERDPYDLSPHHRDPLKYDNLKLN